MFLSLRINPKPETLQVKTRTDEGSMGIIVGTHFDEVHKLLKDE